MVKTLVQLTNSLHRDLNMGHKFYNSINSDEQVQHNSEAGHQHKPLSWMPASILIQHSSFHICFPIPNLMHVENGNHETHLQDKVRKTFLDVDLCVHVATERGKTLTG